MRPIEQRTKAEPLGTDQPSLARGLVAGMRRHQGFDAAGPKGLAAIRDDQAIAIDFDADAALAARFRSGVRGVLDEFE